MGQSIDIEYKKEGDTYRFELTPLDIPAVMALLQKEQQTSETPEQLVSALLKKGKKLYLKTLFYKNDKLNDGPKGEAAYQSFAEGHLFHALHCIDGERTLAQDFNEKAQAIYTVRFKDDYQNTGPKGEPAAQIYEDGQLIYAEYKTKGKLNDGPKGEPARQWFEKGQLVRAARYDQGELVGELSADEINAYLQSQKKPEPKTAPVAKAKGFTA